MRPILCLIGSHKYKNTDGRGHSGEWVCARKGCNKVIPAISRPEPLPRNKNKPEETKRVSIEESAPEYIWLVQDREDPDYLVWQSDQPGEGGVAYVKIEALIKDILPRAEDTLDIMIKEKRG